MIPDALETLFNVEGASYEMIATNTSTAQLKLLIGFAKLGGEAVYSAAFK